MSNSALTELLFLLLLLVGLAQLLGWLFAKIRQPKVVGEILAGVVLGNAVLGRIPAFAHLVRNVARQGNALDFVYWMGLLLLMFLAVLMICLLPGISTWLPDLVMGAAKK